MKIRSSFTILFSLLIVGVFTSAQKLKKVSLTKIDSGAGIVAKYEFGDKYDGYESLCLLQNRKYKYNLVSTGQVSFSSGSWEKKGSDIVLNSSIEKERVPVKLKLLDSVDSSKRVYKTMIQIPVNLKGQLLPDSKIFINDTSTFAFPFFDTIVGSYNKIVKIKVDFGSGFKSDWIFVPEGAYKQILVVAQIDFLFPHYVAFRKKRFKLLMRYLTAIDD